jgi:hypothetical protein
MALSIENERELARLEKIAVWLDSIYSTPIGLRVGWDGILGLVPVVGEFVTTLVSAYLIGRAAMLGASTSVLIRMGLNVVIDDVIAIVPFVGWIGDFYWKSNLMNTKLLRAHLMEPTATRRRSFAVLATLLGVVFVAALTFALLVAIAGWMVVTFIYRQM